jgi:hypothetical protein
VKTYHRVVELFAPPTRRNLAVFQAREDAERYQSGILADNPRAIAWIEVFLDN